MGPEDPAASDHAPGPVQIPGAARGNRRRCAAWDVFPGSGEIHRRILHAPDSRSAIPVREVFRVGSSGSQGSRVLKRGMDAHAWRTACCLAVLTVVAGVHSIAAATQPYPHRPIRMVVPTSAGGVTDAAARIIAPRLTEA